MIQFFFFYFTIKIFLFLSLSFFFFFSKINFFFVFLPLKKVFLFLYHQKRFIQVFAGHILCPCLPSSFLIFLFLIFCLFLFHINLEVHLIPFYQLGNWSFCCFLNQFLKFTTSSMTLLYYLSLSSSPTF